MKFRIDESERKASKSPHEIFLTNLIVNHILYFIAALGMAKSFPLLVAATPVASLLTISYILIKGRKIEQSASWFERCHWQIAMRRSKLLLIVLSTLTILLGILYSIHIFMEVASAQIFPLAAIVTMPVLITILALILMESEALHFAGSGQLSKRMVERNPPPNSIIEIDQHIE